MNLCLLPVYNVAYAFFLIYKTEVHLKLKSAPVGINLFIGQNGNALVTRQELNCLGSSLLPFKIFF